MFIVPILYKLKNAHTLNVIVIFYNLILNNIEIRLSVCTILEFDNDYKKIKPNYK